MRSFVDFFRPCFLFGCAVPPNSNSKHSFFSQILLLTLTAIVSLFTCSSFGLAQGPVENVVLITLDGLRSEEVFSGADERLMIPELGVKNPASMKELFSADSPEARRRKLLPFLWNRIEQHQGWIAGGLAYDSQVTVTNGRYFSYPGYNEILAGFADSSIDSNDKKYNENLTVLEFLGNQADLIGTVRVFCSWDVFPYIINDRRSRIPVNAGWSKLTSGEPHSIATLNYAAENLFREWDGVRYDVFTALGAMESLRNEKPRVLYLALGETDDWAHAGRYDRYLITAQQNDRFIQQLWSETQQHPQFRNKTAFVVTTDHGRGDGREGWKNHGAQLPGSERIWIAAFGSGFSRHGIDQGGSYRQAQVAATVAQLLGYDFPSTDQRVEPPLPIVAELP